MTQVKKTRMQYYRMILSLALILMVYMLVTNIPVNAQTTTGTLSGAVFDAETNEPLPGANVIIQGTHLGVTTDSDGEFQLSDLSPGNYVILISFAGYRRVRENITIQSGITTEITIRLIQDPVWLEGIEVLANTELPSELSVKRFPAARYVVTTRDIESSGTAYIEEALKSVPGIFYQDETGDGTKPNIATRGLDPRRSQRIAILVDDVPVEVAPYGFTGLSLFAIVPERIRDIDVLKGGISVRHGPNTVGGVINMITQPIPIDPQMNVRTSFGSNRYVSGSISGGGTFGNTGVFGQFVAKRGDGFRENSELEVYNYSLKIGHSFSPDTYLELSFDGYDEPKTGLAGSMPRENFNEDFRGTTKPFDYFDGYKYGANLKFHTKFSPDQHFRILTYGHSAFRNFGLMRPNGLAIRESPREYDIFAFEPRYSVSYGSQSNHTLTLGGRILLEFANHSAPEYPINPETGEQTGPPVLRSSVDFETTAWSFYVDNRFQLGDNFVVYPGVRVEIVNIDANQLVTLVNNESTQVDNRASQNFTEFIPGLSMNYSVTDELVFFGNYHRAFRSPQFAQIELSPDLTDLQDWVAETSDNIELGTRIGPYSGIYSDLTFFYIFFDNQVQSDPLTENVLRNVGATRHLGFEQRLVYGFEDLHSGLRGFELNASYTYVHATLATGEFEGNFVPRSPEHRLYWRFGYMPRSGLGIHIDGYSVSSSFQDEANTVVENDIGSIGKIPSYNLLNAGISYRNPDLNLAVFLNVKNITNEIPIHRHSGGIFPAPDRSILLTLSKDIHW